MRFKISLAVNMSPAVALPRASLACVSRYAVQVTSLDHSSVTPCRSRMPALRSTPATAPTIRGKVRRDGRMLIIAAKLGLQIGTPTVEDRLCVWREAEAGCSIDLVTASTAEQVNALRHSFEKTETVQVVRLAAVPGLERAHSVLQRHAERSAIRLLSSGTSSTVLTRLFWSVLIPLRACSILSEGPS